MIVSFCDTKMTKAYGSQNDRWVSQSKWGARRVGYKYLEVKLPLQNSFWLQWLPVPLLFVQLKEDSLYLVKPMCLKSISKHFV